MDQTTMPDVSANYGRGGLADAMLEALRAAGKDLDSLGVDDLAPMDEFHLRGREATRELAELLDIPRGAHVVDVGAGIGGPSRYLARTYGCRVTGVDVTEEFCEVARMFSDRLGLEDQVRFVRANALDLPFPDGSFDLAWTQHASMNIPDKRRLYREMHRVLRPGGRAALYDISAGPGGPAHFPVPWAREPATSFLERPDDMREAARAAGFRVRTWEDRTEEALRWLRGMLEQVRSQGPPTLGLQVLFPDWSTRIANVLRNLEEQRIQVSLGVLDRS